MHRAICGALKQFDRARVALEKGQDLLVQGDSVDAVASFQGACQKALAASSN